MARGKPLSQLSSDLRSGLALGMELAARDITLELKRRGPYWTGQFEAAWEVAAGQVAIEGNLKDSSNQEERDMEPLNKKGQHPTTPVFVPPADESLHGYTIGNLMEYANIAMDLEPGGDGRYRHQRARATAKADWFTSYILGGESTRTLAFSVKQGMRLAGFTR